MNDLSVVDPDLGFAPCPYAKKAFKEEKLKVVECVSRQDLWETIAAQCKNFSDKHSIISNEFYDGIHTKIVRIR